MASGGGRSFYLLAGAIFLLFSFNFYMTYYVRELEVEHAEETLRMAQGFDARLRHQAEEFEERLRRQGDEFQEKVRMVESFAGTVQSQLNEHAMVHRAAGGDGGAGHGGGHGGDPSQQVVKKQDPRKKIVDHSAKFSTDVHEFIRASKRPNFLDGLSFCPSGTWNGDSFVPKSECSLTYTRDDRCMQQHKWVVVAGDSNFRQLYLSLAGTFNLNLGTHPEESPYSDRERFNTDGMRFSFRFTPYIQLSNGSIAYVNVNNLLDTPELAYPDVSDRRLVTPMKIALPRTYTDPDVVFMNTGLWELMGAKADVWESYWEPVLVARFREFLTALRKSPRIKRLVWVTIPAVVPKDPERQMYMTPERIKWMNDFERRLLAEAGIEVIDLYELSLARAQDFSDGYHFAGPLLDWLMQYLVNIVCEK